MLCNRIIIMAVRALVSWMTISVLFQLVQAQGGDWKNYTDMKSIRAVATSNNVLWAGTSGGLFKFDPADSSYQKYTNAEGLSTNDVTALLIDSNGDVWIGQANGAIDVYYPKTDTWRHISNIADDKTKTNRTINALYQYGEKIYIATGFGLTVFSIPKFEFSDTHLGFSTLINPQVLATHIFQNKIFVATSGGVVSADLNTPNLTDPRAWQIVSSVTTVNKFAVFNGELFASSSSGLLKYQANSFVVVSGVTASVRIIASVDTALLYADNQFIRSLTVTSNSVLSGTLPSSITDGVLTTSRDVFVGFADFGIGKYNKTTSGWQYYYPNGPFSNSFYSILVDDNNVLWAVSGRANGKGFYSFDGVRWKNYNTANTSLLLSNDCFAIGLGPNNSKWIGTWGEGLMLVDNKGIVTNRFDYFNTGFIGVIRTGTGLPSYTVPGKIAVDQSGAVWVTIYASIDRTKVLWKMKPDGTWESFAGSPFGPPSFMHNIVIDQNNTKWFINTVPGRAADGGSSVVFYNELKNLMPGRTDGWGTISANEGATSQSVYSVVVDKSGDVWLGTGSGVTIITEPNNPLTRISQVFLGAIRDQVVQSIAIDPLNNKWLGTKQGVFVVSPDGTQLLEQYTVENTNGKLLDNNILSIAFDKKRGIAYFGTEKGLSSLKIAAVETKTSLSTIDLSPNPVYLSDHASVEIRGLVDESTIKVLSIYGKVLKQFPAQGGGRAFWDCTDGEGNRVASGIYIIVAHDRTGTQVASAKVAVVRK